VAKGPSDKLFQLKCLLSGLPVAARMLAMCFCCCNVLRCVAFLRIVLTCCTTAVRANVDTLPQQEAAAGARKRDAAALGDTPPRHPVSGAPGGRGWGWGGGVEKIICCYFPFREGVLNIVCMYFSDGGLKQ
jgi:hypothetical protein